jgi:hypothetical protein
MAEDKDNLMLALGREPGQKESKKFESEGLIGDDDESAVQQFKSEQAVEKQKSEFLQSLKEVGGEKLSQTQIAESLSSLEKTIAQSIDLSVKASVAAIAPDINKDILQVGELLKSMEDKDKEKALDIIEDLQKKLGIDLRNFSGTLSNSIDKLSSIMEKRKAEREKREVELETEQEILKEKGVYTKIVDNQITKERELKILTNRETKEEFKRIREEERKIIEDRKRLDKEQKQLQKGDTIDVKDNKRLLEDRKKINEREEKLNKEKLSLSYNAGDMATGEFDDTKGNLVTKQVEGTTGQASEISSEMPSEEKIRPTTDRPTGDMFTMKRRAPTAISPLEEFTDLSKDYAMAKETTSKPPITFNNVQPMNNVTSSTSETIMPITPMNDDPTFMNLNTRSI